MDQKKHFLRRLRWAVYAAPGAAAAEGLRTGSPGAGEALLAVVGVVAASAVLLAVLAALIVLVLPRRWARPKRWLVALAIAPLGFGVLVLMASGLGWLQPLVAQWLLPAPAP